MALQSVESLLKEADNAKSTNPTRAEQIYKQILDDTAKSQKAGSSTGNEQSLRDQEIALIKLGELYRDTKYVSHVFEMPLLLKFFGKGMHRALLKCYCCPGHS